jgi:hypothetical protein
MQKHQVNLQELLGKHQKAQRGSATKITKVYYQKLIDTTEAFP